MIRCINIAEPYFGAWVFWYDGIVTHPQAARLLSLLPN